MQTASKFNDAKKTRNEFVRKWIVFEDKHFCLDFYAVLDNQNSMAVHQNHFYTKLWRMN